MNIANIELFSNKIQTASKYGFAQVLLHLFFMIIKFIT